MALVWKIWPIVSSRSHFLTATHTHIYRHCMEIGLLLSTTTPQLPPFQIRGDENRDHATNIKLNVNGTVMIMVIISMKGTVNVNFRGVVFFLPKLLLLTSGRAIFPSPQVSFNGPKHNEECGRFVPSIHAPWWGNGFHPVKDAIWRKRYVCV